MSEHLCMEAITVQMVCDAARKLLEKNQTQPASQLQQSFVEISKSFFVDEHFEPAFYRLALSSIDAVFAFNAGQTLSKLNLSKHRSRLQFEIDSPPSPTAVLFLKRYDKPSILTQLKNWSCRHKRISFAFAEFNSAKILSAAGINTPKIISYGEQWGICFEKRSFIISGIRQVSVFAS